MSARRTTLRAATALLGSGALALAGCGGGDDAPEVAQTTPAQTPAVTGPSGPTASPAASGPTGPTAPASTSKPRPARPKPSATQTQASVPTPPVETPKAPPSQPTASTPEEGPRDPRKKGKPVGRVTAGDETAVRKVVGVYLQAIARADGSTACAQLTEKERRRAVRELYEIAPETTGTACEDVIVLYQGAYGKVMLDPKVTRVRVKGRTATASAPNDDRVRLEKTGSTWRISRYDD